MARTSTPLVRGSSSESPLLFSPSFSPSLSYADALLKPKALIPNDSQCQDHFKLLSMSSTIQRANSPVINNEGDATITQYPGYIFRKHHHQLSWSQSKDGPRKYKKRNAAPQQQNKIPTFQTFRQAIQLEKKKYVENHNFKNKRFLQTKTASAKRRKKKQKKTKTRLSEFLLHLTQIAFKNKEIQKNRSKRRNRSKSFQKIKKKRRQLVLS